MLISSLFVAAALIGPFNSPLAAQQEPRPASAPATQVVPKNPKEALAAMTRAMEKNKKRDMSADLDMHINAMGFEIKGTGKMMVSKEGKMRMELSMQVPMSPAPMKQTVVNDGKALWQCTDVPGMPAPMITKGTLDEMKDMQKKMGGGMAGGSGSGDPESQLQDFQKQFDFDTLEEDITIDGKAFWAISGDMKKDAMKDVPAQAKMISGMAKRVRVLFLKEGDVYSGMEMLDAAGKKTVAMVFKNINLAPKFAEDTFTYTPPAGAKVSSFAEMMRGAMGGGAGEDDGDDGDDDEDAAKKAPEKPASKPAGGK